MSERGRDERGQRPRRDHGEVNGRLPAAVQPREDLDVAVADEEDRGEEDEAHGPDRRYAAEHGQRLLGGNGLDPEQEESA